VKWWRRWRVRRAYGRARLRAVERDNARLIQTVLRLIAEREELRSRIAQDADLGTLRGSW
jgi:hypothetical protein